MKGQTYEPTDAKKTSCPLDSTTSKMHYTSRFVHFSYFKSEEQRM